MQISILHISDLHKDLENPVSNEVLLNSVLNDIEQHTSQEDGLNLPDLLVVSGDLIQGVMKDDPCASDNLRMQYDEAEKFLGDLVDKLFNGDRSRVIIVPGNHDIDFFQMYSSLEKVDLISMSQENKSQYANLLFQKRTEFRWSWSDFTLYKISNSDLYNKRFDAFIQFYNRFYQGNRTYSEIPEEQYDVFDFPDFNMTFLGFNSCFENDPWRRQGAVHPDSIAKATTVLRNRKYRNRLRLAVWHHSTKGGPEQDDYLDSDFLQHLIRHGVSLGFHGHQHKPEMLDEKYAFGGDKKVNIISVATLCGGEHALPSGRPRGFNRIMLDTDTHVAKLFVRKMVNDDFQNPIWDSDQNYPEFSFQAPDLSTANVSQMEDLNVAEQMIREQKFSDAVEILIPLKDKNELASPLLLNALAELNNHSKIIQLFNPPQSTEEIILVLNALSEEGRHSDLSTVLNLKNVINHKDPIVIELRNKYLKRLNR